MNGNRIKIIKVNSFFQCIKISVCTKRPLMSAGIRYGTVAAIFVIAFACSRNVPNCCFVRKKLNTKSIIEIIIDNMNYNVILYPFFSFVRMKRITVSPFEVFVLCVDDIHGSQQQIRKHFAYFTTKSVNVKQLNNHLTCIQLSKATNWMLTV